MTPKNPHLPAISLSGELARPVDDHRRRSAQRWKSTLHRLCVLRATMNETAYEIEWSRIFDHRRLVDDLEQRSTLLRLATLDVLEIQHDHGLMVLAEHGIAYDKDIASTNDELLRTFRNLIEDGRPCPSDHLAYLRVSPGAA